MKKLLLSLVALLCVTVGKANIVDSFAQSASWTPSLPTKSGADLSGVFTSEATGIEYTFADCKSYTDYLMVNKSTGYFTFALPEGTNTITVTTGSGASTAVTVNVTVGTEEVATAYQLNKQGADFSFEVPAALQNSKPTCKIAVANNKNAQFQSITFVTEGDGETPVDPDPVDPDPVDPVDPEITKVASIQALLDATKDLANQAKTEELELDFAMTVTYAHDRNTYVTDGKNNLLIYGSLGVEGLENGKVIPAGLKGKMTVYNGLPELTDVVAESIGTLTDGTAVEPVLTTVDDFNGEGISAYIMLEGVDVTGVDGKNFSIVSGETTVAGYNTFGVSVAEGTNLTIVGIVSYFNAYQISPISITTASGKETVAAPTFNPNGGTVFAGTRVNIYSTTEGASIYYTTDGTEPTSASTLYETAIAINEAMTIKAIAVKEGCEDSEVADATFAIKAPADATFVFANPASLTPAYPADMTDESLEEDSNKNGVNGYFANISDVEFTDGGITVTNAKGSSTDARLYYQTGGKIQLRVYNGGSTTISAKAGLLISKIVITYNNGSTSYNKVVAPEEGAWAFDKDASEGTWTAAEGEAGVKSVTFDYTGTQQINAIEVYTEEGSGVDSIGVDSENAAPIYYNLQGVRVDNPANGLYIMKQGTKASKVIVR